VFVHFSMFHVRPGIPRSVKLGLIISFSCWWYCFLSPALTMAPKPKKATEKEKKERAAAAAADAAKLAKAGKAQQQKGRPQKAEEARSAVPSMTTSEVTLGLNADLWLRHKTNVDKVPASSQPPRSKSRRATSSQGQQPANASAGQQQLQLQQTT
jgi:hypothetical protein